MFTIAGRNDHEIGELFGIVSLVPGADLNHVERIEAVRLLWIHGVECPSPALQLAGTRGYGVVLALDVDCND